MVKISFRVRYQELLPPLKATPVHRKKNEKNHGHKLFTSGSQLFSLFDQTKEYNNIIIKDT